MLHAVDRHAFVATACEVMLDSFVRSVRVTDEDRALAGDEVVKFVTDEAVEAGDCSRSAAGHASLRGWVKISR